ncbi:MAG TPA: sulfite exporter TauE/SafE family protein [Gemmatimonadaceae bacterium]|nr:sulfite exporter TauE/SafE family protein [Gemmatimonadaceae bacterium]
MTGLAVALALCVGLSLGLLGGGGGILALPIFVYALGVEPKSAVAMSLAVVGATSFVGFLSHRRQYGVDVRSALTFGAFAMIGSFAGARLSRFVPASAQLTLFAVVAALAAGAMWRNASRESGRKPTTIPPGAGRPRPPAPLRSPDALDARRLPLMAAEALGIGLLTAVVGAGGGFLIVPVLVVLAGLEMRAAIGTSLLVITMNTLSGLAGYLGQVPIHWRLVAPFSLIAIAGALIGTRFVRHVPQRRLKQAFAALILGVSVYVIYRRF